MQQEDHQMQNYEPESPEQYQAMPNTFQNINKNSTDTYTTNKDMNDFNIKAFSVDSKDDFAGIENSDDQELLMTIESTKIRNNSTQQLAYHFQVFVIKGENDNNNTPSSQRRQLVFTSRKTVLDRPCWRDDSVRLDPNLHYIIEIISSLNA